MVFFKGASLGKFLGLFSNKESRRPLNPSHQADQASFNATWSEQHMTQSTMGSNEKLQSPETYLGARSLEYDKFLVGIEHRLHVLSAEATPTVSARNRLLTSLCLRDFIDRIIRGTNLLLNENDETMIMESTSVRCAVIAVEYVERICQKGLTTSNLYKLFLAAFVVAFKISTDNDAGTEWWAHVGGYDSKTVNEMEVQLCCKLEWNLAMPPSCFQNQRKNLELLETTDEAIRPQTVSEVSGI